MIDFTILNIEICCKNVPLKKKTYYWKKTNISISMHHEFSPINSQEMYKTKLCQLMKTCELYSYFCANLKLLTNENITRIKIWFFPVPRAPFFPYCIPPPTIPTENRVIWVTFIAFILGRSIWSWITHNNSYRICKSKHKGYEASKHQTNQYDHTTWHSRNTFTNIPCV